MLYNRVLEYTNSVVNANFLDDLYFDNIDKGVKNDWIGPVEGHFYEQSPRSYKNYLMNLFKLVRRELELIANDIMQGLDGRELSEVRIIFDCSEDQYMDKIPEDEREFFLVGKEVDPEILKHFQWLSSQEGGEK